jgi:uncharacterized protein
VRWDGCVAHAGKILRPIPGTRRISTKLEVVAPEKAISGDGSGIGKPPMHENRDVAEELLDRKPDTTLDARIQLAQAWSKSCLSSTRFRHLCFLSDRKCFNPARDGQNVMSTLTFTLLLAIGSCLAGLLGALTGLGGGVVIVPLLTLAFGVDFRYAVGASLVAVIATSSGAAAVYVREGFTNIRIGMLLEVATTVGALLGAYLAGLISTSILSVILGLVLLYSAYAAVRTKPEHVVAVRDPIAVKLRLDGSYPSVDGEKEYHVQRIPLGFGLMLGAGALSGLLGIGSGAMKVLAMDQAMCLPFKVSTTTSNFMIGVTAAASAGIYLARGYIDPGIAMPVMLGVLVGAALGVRILARTRQKVLRIVYALVIAALAVEMIVRGAAGRI